MTATIEKAPAKRMSLLTIPNNWNDVEDPFDDVVWKRLNKQLWQPEKVPVSNDIQSWSRLTPSEQLSTMRVFTGLTMLDSIQALVGAGSLVADATNHIEVANYNQIAYMESVHAKSYSSIFATLCNTEAIKEAFEWSLDNEQLNRKAEIVYDIYVGNDPLKRKIASTLLESFLFYSGFYLPFYWATRGKLTNTADMIRLITRDESVHGQYIGYKYQRALEKETPERKAELAEFTIDLLLELHENEVKYTEDLYDPLGLTEDVKKFLNYNANKALMNLGYEPLFGKDVTDVNPAIIASLDPTSEAHDFFSGSGSAYQIPDNEETTDDDWA
jgi:ribonucleoside-diphosphate reductase beta chain